MITKAFRSFRTLFGSGRRRRRDASLLISSAVWVELIAELGRRGLGSRESGALLLGPSGGDQRLVSCVVYLDDLDPGCLTGAISFDGRYYSKLWDICARKNLRVRADIHTHPQRSVEQSSIDRANPMVARSGHFALIAPDFATRPLAPEEIGFHEYLGDEGWHSVFTAEAARRLVIVK